MTTMVAATWEFTYTSSPDVAAFGVQFLFWPFFFLFCALAATTILPTLLLLQQLQLLPHISSYSYKSMMKRGVRNRERRNIVTISVLCARTRMHARSFSQQRKDVTRTCTWWTSLFLSLSLSPQIVVRWWWWRLKFERIVHGGLAQHR